MRLNRKKISQLSDNEIISYYSKAKNKNCIGELFNRYSHLVYGVCLKYLANVQESQDAVMQIFEKLIRDIHTNDIENLKGWLYMVSKNYCLMQLRKRKAKSFIKETDIEPIAYSLADEIDTEEMENEIKIKQIMKGIDGLKPEQKTCVKLFYLQQKCYDEVAEITGFSLKQVKSYIQNGRRNLKIQLIKQNELTNQ